jgi:hypothetical protein
MWLMVYVCKMYARAQLYIVDLLTIGPIGKSQGPFPILQSAFLSTGRLWLVEAKWCFNHCTLK